MMIDGSGSSGGSAISDTTLLVNAQDLTGSYADFGVEIEMGNYNTIGVFLIADCNASEDVDLKFLGKFESAGAVEFEIDGISVKRLWSGTGTDFNTYYEIDTGSIPYIQLQAQAGTVGGTAGDLTIIITLRWLP
jgi:hypothetical protein